MAPTLANKGDIINASVFHAHFGYSNNDKMHAHSSLLKFKSLYRVDWHN